MKFLITGCGRSGTGYTSKVFKHIGLEVEHEIKMGKDGISSWLMGVKTERYPWGPKYPKDGFDFIFHQYREPLSTISSLQTFSPISWNYINKFVRVEKDNKIVKAMKYWYHWNSFVMKKANYAYRIENIENAIYDMLIIIGKEKLIESFDKKSISKKTNSRKHKNLSWTDLEKENFGLSIKIKEMAQKIGY